MDGLLAETGEARGDFGQRRRDRRRWRRERLLKIRVPDVRITEVRAHSWASASCAAALASAHLQSAAVRGCHYGPAVSSCACDSTARSAAPFRHAKVRMNVMI